LPRVHGGDTALWVVYPARRLPAAARALAEFLVNALRR
jgi:DNA-binding transcriptional LysR family regulator